MHTLQPKHFKLKPDEVKKLLAELNVSLSQIPKITVEDPALPENCVSGDVIRVERKFNDKFVNYYRVVI